MYPANQSQAIFIWHHHVGEQHVEWTVNYLSLLEQGHGLADALGQSDLAVPGGQLVSQDLQVGRVVIDHQHLELVKLARLHGDAVTLFQWQGQGEEELTAVVAITGQLNLALHHLHQPLGYRQAEACAAEAPGGGAVCLAEGLKQFVLPFRWDADTGIFDREAAGHLLLVLFEQIDAHHHLAAFGEFDRVTDQIGQHLTQSLAVAEQMNRMGGWRAEDFQPFAVGNRGKALDQIL